MDDTKHPTESVRAASSLLGELAAIAKDSGGGFLPLPDRVIVDVTFLAHCVGVSESAVSEWIKKNRVPVYKPGSKHFIDANEFLSCLPKRVGGEPDEPGEPIDQAATRKTRKR